MMTNSEEDPTEYRYVVIFLHGVGGSGSEWRRFLERIVPPRTKLILPTAPTAPVDLFWGREMTSWYNMYDSYSSNIVEVKKMTEVFHKVIQGEVDKGVRPEDIVVGGFSQGGALALYLSLTSPIQLGGTFALSSFLLAPWEFQDKNQTWKNSDSPILICHGQDDFKVPLLWAYHCHRVLSTLTTRCRLKKYVGLGHDVNSAVQHDVQMFLKGLTRRQ